MGCNQSQDQHQPQQQHFQQQMIQGYQNYPKYDQEKSKPYNTDYQLDSLQNKINTNTYNNNNISNINNINNSNNNKTLEKEKKCDEYQLMRKQSILKKTQKVIQENLLCSQQLQSNQALSTRRHYKNEKECFLKDTNTIKQQNQEYFNTNQDYDFEDQENKYYKNINIQQNQQFDMMPKVSSFQQNQKGVQTIADKINEHLKQFSNGQNQKSQIPQEEIQQMKRQSHLTNDQVNAYLMQITNSQQDCQEDIYTSKKLSQKSIQKVHSTKPKKKLIPSETQKVESDIQIEVAQQQQNLVLNFQNKLNLLTMRKYSSSGSSQNTSYQKITQRFNQLSQNSSYILNQSNSVLNFRTGKTHEQCRALFKEIEYLVRSDCHPQLYDDYRRFNALIDKIVSKNGEIKVNVISDTSSPSPSSSNFSSSNNKQQQRQQGGKGQKRCQIQKIQNEIVNFDSFDLIETYLDENCISYDRRFFAKCVANMKQLTSLITQINFVFHYTQKSQNNTSSQYQQQHQQQFQGGNNFKQYNDNNYQINIDQSFSIEIKVQRPFEEEQLNALSKQHSEYQNIYEWYKINEASALGYGFVVNSQFRDEIYTFYLYHEDKNINLQKALSAFSMYGASLHPQVQQKLEQIIPCNDFDLDFHFNQFGLVSIRLNLGKLSPSCQQQLLILYYTHIANCGSIKTFRGKDQSMQYPHQSQQQSRYGIDQNQKQMSKQSSFRNSSTFITSSNSSNRSQQSLKSKNNNNNNILSDDISNLNFCNQYSNNLNTNQLYSIEFNKQGFMLSKTEQIGQDDSASNTQILICEQFK